MHTYSAMTLAAQRQAEDLGRARRRALASEAAHSRPGHSFRWLLGLRRAPLPGAGSAPQGAVSSWRFSHRF
jgi:hypothetical protein